MKKIMNVIILGLFIALLLSIGTVFAAQDELECVLPNGDKFILINKYDYSFLAKFFSHAAERTNQHGFEAYYESKKVKRLFAKAIHRPRSFRPYEIVSELERRKACAAYSEREGYIRAGGYLITINNAAVVNEKPIYPSNILFDEVIKKAKKDNYSILTSTSFRKKSLLIVEITLQHNDDWQSPVVAVIHTKSKNEGQTWSEPIITKDAKLFEIGKSILDQPNVAKPGKWKKGPG